MTTDTSEKGLQNHIVKELVSKYGYIETTSNEFDREFCINKNQLFDFIKESQLDVYNFILQKGERAFLVRLDQQIRNRGIIDIFRKGIKHHDKLIQLFYKLPASKEYAEQVKKYNQNIFSVTQELVYSTDNANRIDLTFFINGLPIITMELKNGFTNQAVFNAIRQYQNTRDPKEKIFNFARCMVHFAVDTDLVFMATQLKEKSTFFLPFNKGLNDGKPFPPFGKGNPLNPEGIKTNYLWNEVLTKESLSNIIEKYAQIIEEKDEDTKKVKQKLIFPRYHQLKVVRELLNHVKNNGSGQRYLIQHSAGSGKSNSITWLAHQLYGIHDKSGEKNIFDSVIIVTDRRNLDEQIRENIKQFAQVKNIVEAITGKGESKTGQLSAALSNRKKLIITTIQTFPNVLEEMGALSSANFAIIIDEAHSSQSGESAAKMNAVLADKEDDEEEKTFEDKIIEIIKARKMLSNASYFAFTATPKNKTLEMFGKKHEDGKFYPFHLYSMRQAIEEEFILDVLQNYTTYNSFYKLIKAVEDNPEFDVNKAHKKLKSYVESNDFAIEQKARIMIDHFNRDVINRINGKAKAMIVAKSIQCAMKYKDAVDAYLKEINASYKAIVAFSGKKAHPSTGVELTEEKMNNFPDGNNDIPKQFKKDIYKILIVANKFQTGFDQPLLHTMYVDKQLSDVKAVQTLSRLNRSYYKKKDTFVLDFYNSFEDIKNAFEPYYTTTILAEETDPNKLNDLQDILDDMQVYSTDEINDFFLKIQSGANRDQLDPIIDRVVAIFENELQPDQQVLFKSSAKTFLRTYSFLSKLLDFNNIYWEKLWWFLKHLTPKLRVEEPEPDEDVLSNIDMDSYRVSKIGSRSIKLDSDSSEIQPIPVSVSGGKPESIYDTLDNILNEFNKRFGDIEWQDPDKVNKILTQQIPNEIKNDIETSSAINSSDKQNAKITSDKKLQDTIHGYMFSHTEIYKKFMDDPDFQKRYQEFIFDMMWKNKKAKVE